MNKNNEQLKILCENYLNNKITLNVFSLQIEQIECVNPVDNKGDALLDLIETAAMTTEGTKKTKEDIELGYFKEPELKKQVEKFLKEF